MKKLMLVALLCVSMGMQGFTITKIGEKEVEGHTTTVKSKYGHLSFKKFTLKQNKQHEDLGSSSAYQLELRAPINMRIDIKDIAEKASSYTICVIDADANPATVAWDIDRDGALQKAYEGRKAAIELQLKKLEEEKNREIKQRIDAFAKHVESERKESLPAAPGGPRG